MKKLLVATGTLIAGVAGLIFFGTARWRTGTATLVGQLRREGTAAPPAVFTPGDLEQLPTPVARYLRAVLPESGQVIRYARLTQRGRFLTRPTPDGWRPFQAVEHFTATPPGFVWDARIRMLPGLTVMVRDGFVGGRGTMVGTAMGLRRLLAIEGTPAISSGALQRYLAEAVWLPTALLPSQGVAWAPLSDSSARATLSAGATTVSVDFHFGADGLVGRIFTAGRERDLGGGRSVPTPWQGRFSRYEQRAGFRIPLAGEVEWMLPEGPQPYWRGEIIQATYE